MELTPLPPNPQTTSSPLPSLSGGGLGSLAQAARDKSIRSVRTCLIVVGVLQMILTGIEFFTLEMQIDGAIAAELKASNMTKSDLDPAEFKKYRDAAIRNGQLIVAGLAVVAVAFFAFAGLTARYPLPMSVSGLVLYVVLQLMLAVLNPATLVSGWLVKIIVILVLVRGISAASASRAASVRTV